MRAPSRCELCEDPLGAGGHDLVGGLALCRRCFLGDLQRVAQARGWTLWSQHEALRLRREDHELCYVTRVRVVLGAEVVLRLKCQRWRWWLAIAGLLRRRARSRDPLFEAHVRVWTPEPAQAERFLREPGVESSLFDVLGNLVESWVEVRGSQLTVEYFADDPHTEGELVARACVLARHVERFAAADNVPRPPVPRGPG